MVKYNVIIVIFGSVISLLGTMIGASLGTFVKHPQDKFLGGIMGFSGGVMLSVVVFDLIPEALKRGSFLHTFFFCIIGIFIIFFVEKIIPQNSAESSMKIGVVTALALMIHNFPEGIIMGCGFAGGSVLGIKMSIAIAIHDIPEGIAVSAPLMASDVKPFKIILYAFLTALPTAFGALIGAYAGNVSQNMLCMNFSLASGIMLYVAVCEMMPESFRIWKGTSGTIGSLIGILCGLILSKL